MTTILDPDDDSIIILGLQQRDMAATCSQYHKNYFNYFAIFSEMQSLLAGQ